ncbi:O-methyltransferase [Arundinibacter roseus]|uniref:Methyltransferase domain-containing protein n=1 Tax=Arundinibacter roseus TaxID=2070510 RepID=A0A4V2XA27_9BACT|nr:class I SAM-dependent methyltransferase [Arundinibacter roseus]TDB66045.1 methyltransferase domain-containing protein [Arundinibacter roseus]
MTDSITQAFPAAYKILEDLTCAAGFTMASDPKAGSFLRTMAATKPGGNFLELGTGTGLSTSWILDGMDAHSQLISIDNDPQLVAIAQKQLGHDERLTLEIADGGDWLTSAQEQRFDYIFADTWHGKYLMLDETLQLLNKGGLYIIDDMLPQPNWPEGHAEKAVKLVATLESRSDIFITKLHWSTGIIVATKK